MKSFLDLPFEILLEIVLNLSPKEFIRLREISRAAKNAIDEMIPSLHHLRFQTTAADGYNAYKEAHIKSVFQRANELEIAWKNDPRYWIVGRDRETRSGFRAQLYYVFWFHVLARFEGVFPGLHFPSFRIKALSSFRSQASLIRIIITAGNEEIYTAVLETFLERNSFDTWSVISLPPINIYKYRQDITIELKDVQTGRTKQGLLLDYFRLSREPPKKEESNIEHSTIFSLLSWFQS